MIALCSRQKGSCGLAEQYASVKTIANSVAAKPIIATSLAV